MATLLDIKQRSTAEHIAVMQAYLDGAVIEAQLRSTDGDEDEWQTLVYPSWDWVSIKYRIKQDGA